MIVEKAYAKLNLALDVVGKRKDGYHDLKMIVVPVSLADLLSFEANDDILLTSDVDIKDNAILKTAYLIKQKYQVKNGAHITLKKNIPIGSGLGGESADIAATIRGLNQLWHLNLSHQELEEIALELGSDTVFCLYNKTALVTGRGEHLEFLQKPSISSVYLCISEHPISTHDSFKNFQKKERDITFETLVLDYKNKRFKLFFDSAFNELLETAFLLDKTLEKTYIDLKNVYKNAYMTGSGSTLFVVEFLEKTINLDEMKAISKRKVIKTTVIG